jgi:hypothetical protein
MNLLSLINSWLDKFYQITTKVLQKYFSQIFRNWTQPKCKQMEIRGRVSRIVKSDPIQVQRGNKLHGDICVQQACMAHSLPPHRLCVAGRLGNSYCTSSHVEGKCCVRFLAACLITVISCHTHTHTASSCVASCGEESRMMSLELGAPEPDGW